MNWKPTELLFFAIVGYFQFNFIILAMLFVFEVYHEEDVIPYVVVGLEMIINFDLSTDQTILDLPVFQPQLVSRVDY